MDIPPKKKRGRKPKENTIINNNPVFADDIESIDNLIIQLNYDKNNTILNELSEIENNDDLIYDKISEVCWNCCHNFNNSITGLPIKYINGVFYTIGDFCSLECASRYAYENYNIYELLPIINIYNNLKYNRNNKINMAPNKLILKKFGGCVSIEDYRINIEISYDVNMPIIHVNSEISKNELKKNSCNNLKLFRNKTKKNQYNIFNKMNLNIN